MDMKQAIQRVADRQDLTGEEAGEVMELLLTGAATQAQIGAFLTGLRMKGETIDEIAGLASVLADKAEHIHPHSDHYIDLVGTGGDCTYSFNISTTSAIVTAAAGVSVAKHGNRSISSKSGAGDVLEQLAAAGLTRTDVVLTLGGGVVGDLGGFAAASFMRGIAFVQIPTSLLAQINSSVGGKVAVDLKAGKNLAGAFYQPKSVFIDTDLLATLSTRFLHDGLAEAIKYGCIKDAALFEKIAGYADDAALLADIDSVVATCCAIKARIVEQDEFDTGLRMLLNFGHTLGHAVEQHFGYSCFTHGEGVAIGMYQLTKRTEELGMTAQGSAERIKSVLEKYNLPLTAGVEKAQLLDTMARDKKKNGNSITLIILQQIGEGVLQKVDWQEVPRYLG